jgi:hypothetical protein
MFISVATVVANIALNTLFVFQLHLGVISTALATSISAFINYWILYRIICKEGWAIPSFFSSIVTIIFASAFAAFCALLIDFFAIPWVFTRHMHFQLLHFFSQIIAFVAGLFFYAKVFTQKELLALFQTFSLNIKDTK